MAIGVLTVIELAIPRFADHNGLSLHRDREPCSGRTLVAR
jgi:hypothetical protein